MGLSAALKFLVLLLALVIVLAGLAVSAWKTLGFLRRRSASRSGDRQTRKTSND